MADKDLNYRIGVDVGSTTPVRRLEDELSKLERTVEDLDDAGDIEIDLEARTVPNVRDTLEDVVDILADIEDEASGAADALVAMATDTDRELRQSATAAEALAEALGESADRFDVDAAVRQLHDLGAGFDEIVDKPDEFAEALLRVEAIEMRQVQDGIRSTGEALDDAAAAGERGGREMGRFAGEAVQQFGRMSDVLRPVSYELGTVVDQAVRGGRSLKDLAATAAPMAGLGLAVAGVNAFLSEQSRIRAWREEQVEGYAEAVREVGAGLGAVEEHLRNVAREGFEASSGISEFLIGGAKIPNVAAAFGSLGVRLEDVSKVIAAGASDTDAAREAIDELRGTYAELGYDADVLGVHFDFLAEQQDAYAKTLAEAEAENAFLATSLEGVNDALDNQAIAAIRADVHWKTLLDDLADGTVNTAGAADSWNRLRDELGLTDEAMAEMVRDRLAEQLAEQEEQLAETIDETNERFRAQAAALRDWAQAFDPVVARAAAFEQAMSQLAGAAELAQFAEIADVVDSMRTLDEAMRNLVDAGADIATLDLVPDTWDEVVNMPDELRPVIDAFAGLAQAIQSEMAQAFAEGGAPALTAWAADMRTAVVDQIKAMGLEADAEIAAIDQTLAALGLREEDIEIAIRLSNEAQARQALDDLAGAIAQLPPEIQLRIAAIAAEDPTAALEELIAYWQSQDIEIPVEMVALLDDFDRDVDRAVDADRTATVDVEPNPQGLRRTDSDINALADADRTADIDTDAPNVDDTAGEIDDAAKDRTSSITADLLQQVIGGLLLGAFLDYVARDRASNINVALPNARDADAELNRVARDRYSNIFVRTRSIGSFGGGATPAAATAASLAEGDSVAAVAEGGVATLATPAGGGGVATLHVAFDTPPVVAPQINIRAGVIGNRYEITRLVTNTQREAIRLAGRRQVLTVGGRNP